jgi:hypothetical protein
MKRYLLTLAVICVSASASVQEQCNVVIASEFTGEYWVEFGTCYATEGAARSAGFLSKKLLVAERSGCCSSHKGVAGCDSKRKKAEGWSN